MNVFQVVYILALFSSIASAEIFSTFTVSAAIGAAVTAFGGYKYLLNEESCTQDWIRNDVEGMHKNMSANIFGQHIAVKILYQAIKARILNKERSRKALVLSLHGWTGTGKNYAISHVAEGLFVNGAKSRFVHFLLGTQYMATGPGRVANQDEIVSRITKANHECSQNLFIFDEVDKMASGLLDVIRPFVDFQDPEGGNYGQNIFVFISNAGGEKINEVVIKQWETGRRRDELTEQDFESIVSGRAVNDVGGLQGSDLIFRALIDHYVPFLPLTRAHVRQCILNVEPNLSPQKVAKILDSLVFWPTDLKLFSTSGCKRIWNKVQYELQLD